MIGWISIAVAEVDRVLRGQLMMTIQLVIFVVHSVATTVRHCWTREDQRKRGCTNQSEVRHDTFLFDRANDEPLRTDAPLRSNATVLICVQRTWECNFSIAIKLHVRKMANGAMSKLSS